MLIYHFPLFHYTDTRFQLLMSIALYRVGPQDSKVEKLSNSLAACLTMLDCCLVYFLFQC